MAHGSTSLPSQVHHLVHKIVGSLYWLPGLVTRVAIGVMFLQTGWGKLHNLDKVIEFFTSLGIPAAQYQAPFVASVEFGGGLLLILGLFTRFAAAPLMGTMVVALLTAKKADITGATDLVGLTEFLYLLLLLWLVIEGAGRVSLDYLLVKKCIENRRG